LRLVTPLKPLAVPASILGLAGIAALFAGSETLAYGPYLVLTIGAAIALWFNRGRAFFALVSLLLAYAGLRFAAGAGAFAARATFTAAAVFVPLNILVALLARERGVFHFRSYRWLLLLAVEITLTVWIASAGATPLSGTAWHTLLETWFFRPAPTPFVGRLLLAVALAVSIARAWEDASPLDVGIGGALVAVFAAFTWAGTAGVLTAFVLAAGAILLVAVLQESHRMAFRDQLTGLPGRRALEEQLLALGPLYTIAMVDVDHFKRFNDTHGHDIGDQVLKLVGARLAQIGGGGRSFRYGGEEFSVLFADQSLKQALPHLEQLRADIENYRMALRTHERRRESRGGRDRRALPGKRRASSSNGGTRSPGETSPPPDGSLSVTVSIGVAERDGSLASPSAVIKAADQALYRAKQAGRNRVSS
jgi:diguanylate cyclase (GGDEF)-like protein